MPAHSNHPVTDFARRYYTRELRRAGASVLLYSAGMLHRKAIIVDDRVGLLGSANFDLRSLFVNFEIGVVVHSAPEVRRCKAWADGAARSTACPRRTARTSAGFSSGLVEDLSRLLAPLL